MQEATKVNIPTTQKQDKHTQMQRAIEHVESVCRELNGLADRIQGSDPGDNVKSIDVPEPQMEPMVAVLDNGPEQLNSYVHRCQDTLGRIKELLF